MARLQVTDQAITVAGMPLPPAAFTGLVTRHPKGIERALVLEEAARHLFAANFSAQRLRRFIRDVCEWGGYPGTARRVLQGNPFPEIRRRFTRAIAALTPDEPNIQSALLEISRVRHLGLSFASKHLRLLRPDVCPVLDSVLSEKLGYALSAPGYQRFSDDCLEVAAVLHRHGVSNPVGRDEGAWFAADVEMALFVYVKEQAALL